jgi:hypothetical protein
MRPIATFKSPTKTRPSRVEIRPLRLGLKRQRLDREANRSILELVNASH